MKGKSISMQWLPSLAQAGGDGVEGARCTHDAVGTGEIPEVCRFLLNTQLLLLREEREPTTKRCDGS